jgi:hypothetical protein
MRMLTQGTYWRSLAARGAALAAIVLLPALARAEYQGELQILLLGDSATEASIPRKIAPDEAQFEDVIRILLAAEEDLPPTNVINSGVSGEFIRRLLDSSSPSCPRCMKSFSWALAAIPQSPDQPMAGAGPCRVMLFPRNRIFWTERGLTGYGRGGSFAR